MKFVEGAAVIAGVALAVGGSSRFLAHGRAAPWVERTVTANARAAEERAAYLNSLSRAHQLRAVATVAGERLFVWGPLRVAWGTTVRFGRDVPRAEIINETSVARGWIFHARDGLLYRSETFTGELRPMTLPDDRCATPWVQPSFGRAVVGTQEALYASDGGAFARINGAPPIASAAFGSAMWGLGLAHGGRVFETRDGGESWAPVASIPELADRVIGFPGGVTYCAGSCRDMYAAGATAGALSSPTATAGDAEAIEAAFRHQTGSAPTPTATARGCRP